MVVQIKVIIIFLLMMVISAIGSFAYGARLAGVRTRSISSSSALYNILTLFSRTANMLLLPMIGSIVEQGIRSGDIAKLTSDFRLIFLGSTLGTGLSIILIPYMADIFIHAVRKLEQHKSIPQVMIKESNPKNLIRLIKMFRFGSVDSIKRSSMKNLPKGFLILNPIIYAIYSVGFLSALYAGALTPENRLVASQLSSAINGFATIALFILVDPVLSVISDEVINEKRDIQDLKSSILYLSTGRFIGTLAAQLIFVPVAYFIVWVSRFFI